MTILIDRISKQGKPFQVRYEDGEFIVTHDGQEVARSTSYGHRGNGVHVFADKVGLTFAEGDILRNAYEARLMAMPRTVTRAELAADYESLIEEQADAFQRAHDRADARAWSIKAGYEARIEAARQAIVAYDAANPRQAQPMSAGAARMLRGED